MKKSLILFLFILGVFSMPVYAQKPILMVVLGDSLTAGYGLSASDSFASQLEKALNREGYAVKVVNAGISGDTTQGGVLRIQSLIDRKPDFMIIELGANDSFRLIDPKQVKQNLAQMIELSQKQGIPVLLAGMKAPTSYDSEYQSYFNAIYSDLADQYNIPLYPFFMQGLVDLQTNTLNQALLLPDQIHPTTEGVSKMVNHILPTVKSFIERFN